MSEDRFPDPFRSKLPPPIGGGEAAYLPLNPVSASVGNPRRYATPLPAVAPFKDTWLAPFLTYFQNPPLALLMLANKWDATVFQSAVRLKETQAGLVARRRDEADDARRHNERNVDPAIAEVRAMRNKAFEEYAALVARLQNDRSTSTPLLAAAAVADDVGSIGGDDGADAADGHAGDVNADAGDHSGDAGGRPQVSGAFTLGKGALAALAGVRYDPGDATSKATRWSKIGTKLVLGPMFGWAFLSHLGAIDITAVWTGDAFNVLLGAAFGVVAVDRFDAAIRRFAKLASEARLAKGEGDFRWTLAASIALVLAVVFGEAWITGGAFLRAAGFEAGMSELGGVPAAPVGSAPWSLTAAYSVVMLAYAAAIWAEGWRDNATVVANVLDLHDRLLRGEPYQTPEDVPQKRIAAARAEYVAQDALLAAREKAIESTRKPVDLSLTEADKGQIGEEAKQVANEYADFLRDLGRVERRIGRPNRWGLFG